MLRHEAGLCADLCGRHEDSLRLAAHACRRRGILRGDGHVLLWVPSRLDASVCRLSYSSVAIGKREGDWTGARTRELRRGARREALVAQSSHTEAELARSFKPQYRDERLH
ncbi:hypothetical protein L1887_51515 [Cichorium endivia]|nr:hypothetical protein L1887_51515 [Cichorium endivia]